MGKHRSYNMQTNTYRNRVNSIPRAKNLAAIMITNVGDTVAFFERMILNPDPRNVVTPTETFLGDSYSIALGENDVYVGNMDLFFETPLGSNPAVQVTQVFYTED